MVVSQIWGPHPGTPKWPKIKGSGKKKQHFGLVPEKNIHFRIWEVLPLNDKDPRFEINVCTP